MKTVTPHFDFIAFLQMHDVAIALALIFAFAGAVAMSPMQVKS